MEKIAYKLFTFGDFDEEEVWLNAMVEQGWALKSVHWMKYRFEACQKGEYIYRDGKMLVIGWKNNKPHGTGWLKINSYTLP